MKRTITSLIAAMILVLSGCSAVEESSAAGQNTPQQTEPQSIEQTEPTSSEQPEPQGTEQTEPSTTQEAPEEEPQIFDFKKGVWLYSVDGEYTDFYLFYGDGGGVTLSLEMGIGVAFQYESDGTNAVFHMGAADVNDNAELDFTDENTCAVNWEDSVAGQLTFFRDADPVQFDFYSNEELCRMALDYYTAQTGYTPSSAGSRSNADGTVTIQLYDNLEDHNSTSAWYTVDRFTAEGTDDITGEPVSFIAG